MCWRGDRRRRCDVVPVTAVLVERDYEQHVVPMGGVQYALRNGVPLVATGGKEDKPEVGGRVVWSGVGRRIRSEHPSPHALRRAIRRVLHEPRYGNTSRRIAADMATAPGLDGLTAIVDGLTGRAGSDPRPALAC
jgi:UDP:flavonoid glycosyltransferase YjiC (YdhE family)